MENYEFGPIKPDPVEWQRPVPASWLDEPDQWIVDVDEYLGD